MKHILLFSLLLTSQVFADDVVTNTVQDAKHLEAMNNCLRNNTLADCVKMDEAQKNMKNLDKLMDQATHQTDAQKARIAEQDRIMAEYRKCFDKAGTDAEMAACQKITQ